MPSSTQGSRNIPCTLCKRRFKTSTALDQHARATGHIIVGAPIDTESSSSNPPERLRHRGIAYSALSVVAQQAVRVQLPGLCHTLERLKQERYVLEPSDVASTKGVTSLEPFQSCPSSNSATKEWAVLLDCEMAGAVGGRDEVIRITIVDFLSGKTLLDSLVNPSTPIADWREDITGINAGHMREAVERNETLAGWKEARAQLWRFVDEKTIIVGQSVHNDLHALHTCHATIIDSAIVTADAVLKNRPKIRKRWGLVALSRELAGIEIRKPQWPNGPKAHDALEDALAAREVILTCFLQPDKLEKWASKTRTTFFSGKRQGQKRRQKRQTGIGKVPQKVTARRYIDSDEEHLTWDDVVDWDMWPKSPPDSD